MGYQSRLRLDSRGIAPKYLPLGVTYLRAASLLHLAAKLQVELTKRKYKKATPKRETINNSTVKACTSRLQYT